MPDRVTDEREIEAVARALVDFDNDRFAREVEAGHSPPSPRLKYEDLCDEYNTKAERGIAALDRIRDARSDEGRAPCPDCLKSASGLCSWHRDYGPASLSPSQMREMGRQPGSRSPQGEDHEEDDPFPAFIDEWLCPTCGGPFCRGAGEDPPHERPRIGVRYYRSPSRDGTVAVEDVAGWLRERFPSGTTMMAQDRKHGDVQQTKGEYVAEVFLSAFSRPSTDDQ